MCDDLGSEMETLLHKGINCSEVENARWGSVRKSSFRVEDRAACMSRATKVILNQSF